MSDFKKRLRAALKGTNKIKYKKGGYIYEDGGAKKRAAAAEAKRIADAKKNAANTIRTTTKGDRGNRQAEGGGYIKPAGGGDQVVYGATHAQGGVDRNPQVELEGGGYTSSGQPKAGEVITTIYDNGGNPQEFYMSHKNGVAQKYLQAKANNGGSLPQQTKQEFAKLNESMNPDGSPSGVAANGGMKQYFMGGMGRNPQRGGPIAPNSNFNNNNEASKYDQSQIAMEKYKNLRQAQGGFGPGYQYPHGGYHKRMENYPVWLDKSINWLRGGVEKSKESGVLGSLQSGADALSESKVNKALQRGGEIFSTPGMSTEDYRRYVYNPDKFNATALHPLFAFKKDSPPPPPGTLMLQPWQKTEEGSDDFPQGKDKFVDWSQQDDDGDGIPNSLDGEPNTTVVPEEEIVTGGPDSNTGTGTGTGGGGRSKSSGDPDTKTLQDDLLSKGYELPKWGADGKMGDETQGAIDQMNADKANAAAGYGISEDDLEWDPNNTGDKGYGTSKGGWKPKEGAKNTEWGDTWNSEDGTWRDDANEVFYDSEGEVITKEEYDKLDNTTKENKQLEDGNTSFLDRIGINNITDGIEILSIMKADRYAKKQNEKLGKLNVKSKKVKPGTYTPELVDMSQEKVDAQTTGTAIAKMALEQGKSVAEVRALMMGTQEQIGKIGLKEKELQKKQNNFAKKMNIDSQFKADVTNITNDRMDQVANNDALASMFKNNIALSQNMRDAISTKIKDNKLLRAAENEMMVINEAIAGGTGTDIRKGIPAIKRLMNNGTVSTTVGNELITNLQNMWKTENPENTDNTEEVTSETNVEDLLYTPPSNDNEEIMAE